MPAFYAAIGLRFEQEQHGTGPLHDSAQIGATVFELYILGSKDATDTPTRLGFAVDNLCACYFFGEDVNGAFTLPR